MSSINTTNNVSFQQLFIDVVKSSIYYSPIILSICVIVLSFLFQTLTGFFFFIFILFFTAIRFGFVQFVPKIPFMEEGKVNKWCSINDPYNTGNGFVVFYTVFIVFYILAPMMIYGVYNFYLFSFLLIYLIAIMVFNIYVDKCMNMTGLLLNFGGGFVSALISIMLLVQSGNVKLLFMNALDTDSNFCSMPTSQTFKCNVYKNGEVIASSLS